MPVWRAGSSGLKINCGKFLLEKSQQRYQNVSNQYRKPKETTMAQQQIAPQQVVFLKG
jgi:hypothetical protein